jgi:very-short-patch-repair endonuclease
MANERARQLRKTMTPQEVKLWVRLRELRALGYHFRRQVPRAGYILDFACLREGLVVEVDGTQHGYDDAARRDGERDRRVARDGLMTLRFWNGEIDKNLDGVIEAILAALSGQKNAGPDDPTPGLRPDPPRSGEG